MIETMTHKLLLDTQSYSIKPEQREIGVISKRIINFPSEIGIDALAQAVGEEGRTFVPAYLEGKRNNDSWKSQSVFMLDFDEGITFEQVMMRLKENGLDCTFAYRTFSDSAALPKFRLVWQLDCCLIDKSFRDCFQIALMELFPEADKSCKDASRIVFGGKGLLCSNYEYLLSVDSLIEAARLYVAITKGANGHQSRTLTTFDKKTKELKNNRGVKRRENGVDSAVTNNIYSDCAINSKFDLLSTHTRKSLTTLRGVDFETLRLKVRILDEFMKGEKIYHPELLGLATNLRWIEGGQKIFCETIEQNEIIYDVEEKKLIMTYAVQQDYLPMKLSNFSPYELDHNWSTLYQAAKPSIIARLTPFIGNTLDEARQHLQQVFHEAYWGNSEASIHIIKGVTGLGKTRLYETLSKSSNPLIALPTHALKDEIVNERMKGIFSSTPSPECLPRQLKNKMDALYQIGATTEASSLLMEAAKLDSDTAQFLSKTLACYTSTNTVLTTHQKAVFIDWSNHNTIIFDEDPLQILLPIQKTSLADICRAAEFLEGKDKETLNEFISQYTSLTGIQKNPILIRDESYLRTSILDSSCKWDGAVLDFFFCDYWVKDSLDPSKIVFITRRDLPSNKKIIILSATANEEIYKTLYGDRVCFHDLSNVEPSALIEQHTTHSMSRTSLPNHLDWARETVGSLPVITFANNKILFSNPVEEAHFGKCTGFDGLKGKDIAVVGTPHPSPSTIALYGAALGILEAGASVPKPRKQTVNHKGFSFPFTTYDSLELRTLHFHLVENDLKQAIGRARPYSESCKIILLANYPLPEAFIVGVDKIPKARESKETLSESKVTLEAMWQADLGNVNHADRPISEDTIRNRASKALAEEFNVYADSVPF
jgi:hypothetical protein